MQNKIKQQVVKQASLLFRLLRQLLCHSYPLMDSLSQTVQPLGNGKIILRVPETRPQSNKNSIKFSGQQQQHQNIRPCLLLARTINKSLSPGLLHVPFTDTWPHVSKKMKVITLYSFFHVSTPLIPKAFVCALPLKRPQYIHVFPLAVGKHR